MTLAAEGNPGLVFAILVPLFLAVGVYLIVYNLRRRRLLRSFAGAKSLPYRPADDGTLEHRLNSAFRLEGSGRVRAFSRIRDIVENGPLRLFRVTELLDLNPHGQAPSTHFGRIAVLVTVEAQPPAFATFEPGAEGWRRRPRGEASEEPLKAVEKLLLQCPPRHPLTVTFAGASALLYLEPFRVGGESLEDVECLHELGRRLGEALRAD